MSNKLRYTLTIVVERFPDKVFHSPNASIDQIIDSEKMFLEKHTYWFIENASIKERNVSIEVIEK